MRKRQKSHVLLDSKHEKGGGIIAIIFTWEHFNRGSCSNQIKCIKGVEDSRPWTALKMELVLMSAVFEM